MNRTPIILFLFITRFAFSQMQDTSDYSKWRYKIQDESFFIKLNPNDPWHYYNRGNNKAKINDYTGAINDISKAILLDSTQKVYPQNRANFYAALKDYQNAIKDYSRAIYLFPQ